MVGRRQVVVHGQPSGGRVNCRWRSDGRKHVGSNFKLDWLARSAGNLNHRHANLSVYLKLPTAYPDHNCT